MNIFSFVCVTCYGHVQKVLPKPLKYDFFKCSFFAIFFIIDVGMPIFGDSGENIPKLPKMPFKTHKSNIWAK